FVGVANAQQSAETIKIIAVDASGFPVVSVAFVAQDADGNGLETFNDLQLFENDQPISDLNLISLPVGVDLTFVIDANRTITGIDLIGDISRLEKVKAAIATYAQQYVSRAGLDHISVIAPLNGEAAWLLQDVADPDQIAAQIADYNPTEFANAAPVDAMLRLAFQQSAERTPSNRYQAIILLSDAEFLADQVDFFAVREIASQSEAVFFGAILGKTASQSEIDNMAELYIPTGGTWAHMPQVDTIDPLFRTIKSNSDQRVIRYRSSVATTGTQRIQLLVDGNTQESSYELLIEPPQIEWLLLNQPILREGEAGAAAETLSPQNFLIETQLVWPDGFPRELTQVRFFVNDLEQRIEPAPVLDGNGILTFEWRIANLAPDIYRLEIELTDELGLSARSAPFLQRIDYDVTAETLAEAVDSAETQPTVEPTLAPTPSPLAGASEKIAPFVTERNLQYGMGGLVALLAVIFLWRWRKRGDKAFSADVDPAGNVILPENVYIELLGARDSIASRIPVLAQSVRIGSDPFKADIVFDDDSVSRFHARLNYENGGFVLYDEGSAFGTRVNFEPIGLTPRPIQDTDELTFGSIRTRFRIYGAKDEGRTIRPTDKDKIERRFSLAPPEIKEIKAVIFDLDGTLLDSESVAMVAWAATVAKFGVEMDQRHQRLIIGVRLEEALDNVIDYFNLPIS
ncbi:MAG TPA: FHA domain-containing protein, partial [Anaerolineae bacterium]|nr:FHA domain-containing protein [Anaerolineae bacterium]